MKKNIINQACTGLRNVAKENFTEAIDTLNRFMLPPELPRSRPLAAVAPAAANPATTIDWTKVRHLKWMDWFFEQVIKPSGVNEVLQWALNGTGRVEVWVNSL